MHNMPGPDRAMAYRVALGTGFRAKELRSLTPASFDLDADPPTVTVTAGYSKRRRQDVQPIRPDLAELLRPWLAKYGRDEHPFAAMPERTARMLQDDLDEARRRWLQDAKTDAERAERERADFLKHIDADGRVFDFHGDAAHVHFRHRGRRGIGQDLPRVGPAFDPDAYHRPVFPRPVTRPDGGP